MTNTNMSYQDVLDALMLEEPVPTYAALERWQKLYPDYGPALADFFATWAIQQDWPQDPPEIDEERIARKGVAHAMEILRRQRRVVSKETVELLTAFEQLTLTAVEQLQGRGYSLS